MKLIKNASKDKLRGGFYTPPPIADFILKWAFNGNARKKDILEPSCGDGIFLKQLHKGNYAYNRIVGIELDKEEAKKTTELSLSKTTILNQDFHQYCNTTKDKFDIIIGNPPYIRYQYFEKEQQLEAIRIFTKASLKYSKLTNAWVSFIVGSTLLLKDTGKIGFVIPAEILQVSYAKTLRQFLAKQYNKIIIISFKKLVFPNIQQEVVLLLCEKDSSNTHSIEHKEVSDAKDLIKLNLDTLKKSNKKLNINTNKWTYYFLNQKEIDFLEEIKNTDTIPFLGDYANVEVGITTGSNPFFTVDKTVVEKYQLEAYAKAMVGRSFQVNGSIFNTQDWKKNSEKGARAYFLQFPPLKELEQENGALEYIALGESKDIHQGYKCRIREEWQIVPSIRLSNALFIRRNNRFPKLIKNEAKVYTTDTMHRVHSKPNVNIEAFIASYYNSLSFAFSEISGRSYGGGVLELMPTEVKEIRLPYKITNASLLVDIDAMLREKKDILKILEYTNNILLKQNYNFSKSDIKLSHDIWLKLSNRRLNRK